jgi:hypothetical protein
VESDIKPEKYIVENILNNECEIVLNDNITEEQRIDFDAETGKAISRTIYKFDIYRIPTIYRDNLEKELSTAKGYKTWINFAKEQYAKQIVDIPDVDRISALEQAIMEIGEVLGNG